MNRIVLSTTVVLAAATPLALPGADGSENLNRFSLGARFGYNFKADFRNNATVTPGNVNPGPAAPGADHTYNDGYVLLDSSGNAGGLTWNWGYQNASQVVGDTMKFTAIEFNSSGSAGKVTDDPQLGVELIYQRLVGRLGSGDKAWWGLEVGLGYTDIGLSDKRSTTGVVTTDTFQLNGVIPPGPGYNGTFSGPGALLGDTPTRTTAAGGPSLTSHNELSGQMFGIRLGPVAEWRFTSKFSLAGSVGAALAPTSLDYDFTETAPLVGGGTSLTTGRASETEVLYGYYVSAMLRYDFAQCWGVYIGGQFQSLNDLKLSAGSHTAKLDPGETIYGTVGLTWRF